MWLGAELGMQGARGAQAGGRRRRRRAAAGARGAGLAGQQARGLGAGCVAWALGTRASYELCTRCIRPVFDLV